MCLAGLVSSASAQSLSGQWFKVTVNASGVAVTPESQTENAKGKFVVYMFVQEIAKFSGLGGTQYVYTVWGEVADDEWEEIQSEAVMSTTLDEKTLYGPDGFGIPLFVTVPPGPGGSVELGLNFTARLKVKKNKQGEFKSATFKSLGALITEGSSDEDVLLGGAKITGKSVPVGKLPFPIIS